MTLTSLHYAGFTACILIIAAISVYSGRKVSTSSDFLAAGGKGGLLMVTGLLFGTNIGGGSTIGTAQSAFQGGLYGIWWCLGLALGGLLVGLVCSRPMKELGCSTMQELIRRKYGETAALVSAVLSSLGVLISIVAQQLSAIALLTAFFPIGQTAAGLISVGLMALYVLFGGAMGAGLVGMFKVALLFLLSLVGGGVVLFSLRGIPGGLANLPAEQFFSLRAGGLGNNVASALSVMIGLPCSQIFFQVFATAKDERTGRRACIINSLLLVPVCASSVLIGMFMRLIRPELSAASAFPAFVIDWLPSLFGGVAIAALLITIVGSGAGVTLGISTVMSRDLFGHFRPNAPDRTRLTVTRMCIAGILAATWLIAGTNLGSYVLSWNFLSMAFRSAVNCAPLFAALFLRRCVSQRWCLASMAAGVITYLLALSFLPKTVDPIFVSIPLSLLVLMTGYLRKAESPSESHH